MPAPLPLVALVTAGSAGLGAATARLFAKSGIRCVVNYHSNGGRAAALVQELEASSAVAGGQQDGRADFCAVQADLASRDDVVRLVETAVAAMGRLDVVFSNGGWTRLRNFADLDDNMVEADWDRCFAMNVKPHLWLMHAAKPHLEAADGVFITTASTAGTTPGGSSLVRVCVCVCGVCLLRARHLGRSTPV